MRLTYSNRMIAVSANHAGPRLVEPLTELMNRKSLLIERSIVNLVPGQNFFVRITKHSEQDRFLFKDARVGYTIPLFGERGADVLEAGKFASGSLEEEFDQTQFMTGKFDPSRFCPATDEVAIISYEGEGLVEKNTNPGAEYATTFINYKKR